MFCVIDKENNFTPVKSGFKTASQANNWAKKNLPKDEVHLWGEKHNLSKGLRYFVQMKCG
jgi:hypothetical protein